MATNTHIQRGAQRRLAAMFLLAAAIGGGALAGRTALPVQGSTAASSTRHTASRSSSYGWPVKPFDQQHPLRGSFGDPRSVFRGAPTPAGLMHSQCACSYHQGIDISAPDGTAVYAVLDGVVRTVTPDWVEVDSDNGVGFQYWHITARVREGQNVDARSDVLGTIQKGSKHVHLTELKDGKAVNPLAPGHIGPYTDETSPAVGAITFRSGDTGPELLPEYLHGSVELVASASDTPAIPVPAPWNGLPVTPAKLTFHISAFPDGKVIVPETTALDVTRTLPGTSDMWHTYARGTHMNMVQMGVHRYWYQPGSYLFKLTAAPFDTHRLADGVYRLTVTASDTAGNAGHASQIFQVHNRKTWLRG
ncbi:MAG: peptidoglycan DD-metalloendopeptidase family protein [Gaiellaceae bacterium]